MNKFILVLSLTCILFISCNKVESETPKFGIFSVLIDRTTIEMDGVINSKSLKNFNKLYSLYPKVQKIDIKNCDGSMDDEVNLLLSSKVHDLKINIHLLDNGIIASGGVDFFLAGIERTKGSNTKIGVHSWAGTDKDGKEVSAKNFPVGHQNHLPYINYYKTVGFTQKNAEAFYYFTINAAPANSIHWMTDKEISQYKLLTD